MAILGHELGNHDKSLMKISADGVCMSYDDAGKPVCVLKGITFSVPSGDSVAIVGESGVGKTTLLNIVGGLERPDCGEVFVGDTCITKDLKSSAELARFRGRNIGFIFQFFQLLPEFDALENVAMPLVLRGMRRAKANLLAKDCLGSIGLSSRLTHRPYMLSGGEQQRVAIARALVGKPGVLLADEPTGNLDERTGDAIGRLLLDVQSERGATLIVVTHSRELSSMMKKTLRLTATGLE